MKAIARGGLACYGHLFFLAFWGSLVAGYFYYGFFNEGDWTCYATQDDDVTVPWDKRTQGDAPDEYHDVNANFKVVCIWGFFNYLFALLLWLFVLTVKGSLEEPIGPCVAISIAVLGTCWLAHFLTLMIMRWRHAGKTCSGDYYEDVSRYSLFHTTEPYLHDAGSFLFYAIVSQFTAALAFISAAGINIGIES